MVTPTPEKRSSSEYSLQALHRLAGFGKVAYVGRTVEQDIEDELGLGVDDVCTLLSSLQPTNFHHAVRYEGDARWHDVYLLPYPSAGDRNRKLYIKFRINLSCVVIQLCSFHPERKT
ncbi:MAG: type II toxin-antitoxin system MqsR family toxin [Rhodanobacteraceae bacterium]|nr:type II toxin-antitoxin system MqsR family toxin [Rhodanobacteraceae bacterium]